VKIKKILSISLIFLTLLCSSEVFSQIDRTLKYQANEETEFGGFSQDAPQEFRESFKIILSEESRSNSGFILDNSTFFTFNTVSYWRYQSYLKAYLSKKSSSKLFIDFGSIII
jgi:hypothetical protein